MPFDAGTAQGKLDLDTSGFNGALKGAENALGGFLGKANSLAKGALIGGLAVGVAAVTASLAGLAAALVKGSQLQSSYERAVVGLSNVLKQQGAGSYKAITAEVEAYATAVQRTTGINDEAVLNIGRQLAALGVQGRSLRPAIQTVLDFAAATGISAERAARGFAASLQGNAGILGRYIPQLKQLTASQLQAGAAFNFARDAASGQAEALGNTFAGRIDRLVASFDDLLKVGGKAFNEAFGPVFTEIQGAIDELTDRLSQGAGLDFLKQAGVAAAEAVRVAFNTVLTIGPDVISAIISVGSALAVVGTAAAKLGQITAIAFGQFELADQIGRITDGLIAATQKALDFRDQVDAAGKTLRATVDPTKSIRENVAKTADAFGLVRKEADKTAATIREVNIATGAGALGAAQRTRDMWAKVNEEVGKTAGSVSDVTSETRNAASAADDLADSYQSAAVSADSAAQSASNAIASLSASRTQAGSTALDFSDPFRALAQNAQAQAALGRARYSAYAGSTQINAAAQFAQGVQSFAQASIDRAFADFTAQVLSELSAQGIYDPTQRNRIVRERTAEAQRFGILPPTQEVRSIY